MSQFKHSLSPLNVFVVCSVTNPLPKKEKSSVTFCEQPSVFVSFVQVCLLFKKHLNQSNISGNVY